jgi:uncharacterized protein
MPSSRSWLNPLLEARESPRHGEGVFAKASIPLGTRVAIFGGDILLIDEINDVPDHMSDYPMQIEERFVLGSRHATKPEDTDFFNHSCDPNCGFKGQIFLVTMRDVALGEEMTFDYAMVVSESVGSDIKFELDCACGSVHCRHHITESDWMLPDLQRRYEGFFTQYLEEKIAHLKKSP